MEKQQISQAVSRNVNLDLIKLMSCFAVVGLHTLNRNISIFNSVLYLLCGFAVPVFFASSGYMLFQKKEATWKYVFHKIINILRVVVIWTSAMFFIELIARLCFKKSIDNYGILSLPLSILKCFIQQGRFYQFWYFGAMIIIYLLLPFMIKIARGKGNANNGMALFKCWLIFAVFSIIIQGISLIYNTPLQANVIQTFRIWSWLQYFLLGGVMIYAVPFIKEKMSIVLHGVLTVVFSAIIPIWQNIAGCCIINETRAEFYYDDILTIIWVMLIFSYIMRISLNGSYIQTLIRNLSPLTMGVYIIHPLVIIVIKKVISVNSPITAVVAWAAVSVIAFVASFVISRLPYGKKLITL